MTSRVLFACWPFEGHVFPQLSMALALRERGADVAFYTDGSARELIEGEGFEVFPFKRVGPKWRRVHEGAQGAGGRRDAIRLLRESREWIVGTIADQVADIEDVTADWRPDVIGAEASMWGPLLVLSERSPVPVALVSPLITAQLPGPDAPAAGGLARAGTPRAQRINRIAERLTAVAARPMRRRIDAIRARYGLAPLGCAVTAAGGRLPLYLVLSTPELDYNRRDLPASVHYVGPCLWHPREPDGTREWLDGLPTGRPWVHVTEGTSHFQQPMLLSAAASGLAGAPCEAILTTGRGRAPHELGLASPAPNVHVTQWLSHDVLLPRCAAIVTTGGMGTVMAALRAGIPLVVVPTNWDKPTIAQRVVDAGVGVRLAPRRCTPTRLREAVERVLRDQRYGERARRLAARLAAAPGPDGAAELIEQLALAQHEPTVAVATEPEGSHT
jgi:MGT family glycosyltransferase